MTRKVILLLAFSLFAFCHGETECGENQCKDLWSAKKCNKVKYCIEEEWIKMKPLGNRDSVCEICLRMVKEARDTLRSNETREELLQVFEGSCNLLVLKPAVEVCDELAKEFVPELVDILSSRMDPETVCTVAKLCNNEAFATAFKHSKDCIYCESFAENAGHGMNVLTEKDFKNELFKRCRTTSSFTDACYFISSIYSDVMYKTAKSILNGKPCEAFSLCPSGSLHPDSIVKVKKGMCPLCKTVMTSVEQHLLNVKTPKEFSDVVFGICQKFNFPHETCLDVSNSGLFDKLKKKNLSQLLCRVSFCGEKINMLGITENLIPYGNDSFSATRDMSFIDIVESFETFFPPEVEVKKEFETTTQAVRPTISFGDPVDTPLFLPRMMALPTLVDCNTCRDVLTTVESRGFEKSLSEFGINDVCNKMGDAEKCKKFLSTFSQVLTKSYNTGLESGKICESLVPTCRRKKEEPTTDVSTSYNCQICMKSVKTFKNGSWEIKDEEDKCSLFPSNSKSICNFVFTYLPWIFQNYDEKAICSPICVLPFSAIQSQNKTNSSKVEESFKSTCKNCIAALNELKELSKNKENAIIVETLLRGFCFLLPSREKNMCDYVIEEIGVHKFMEFLQNIQPEEVCTELRICSKNNKNDNSYTGVTDRRKIPCKFCLMAIRTLMDELQNDKTEEAIRKALEGLCKYFPEETRDTCKNLIDQYAEDIIDMIIADFNATEICTYLKICPESHLLLSHSSSELAVTSNKNNFEVFDVETNQIYDVEEKPFLKSEDEEKPSPMDLEKLHEYVKECALCEALVGVINSHESMLTKDYDFSAHADRICSIVPNNDVEKCKSLLISYGPSIVNLIVDKKVDINDVCVYIDLCDPKMQAKVNQPVSVSEDKFIPKENECTKGPRFWCASAENAEKCGTFLHCQETVWKNWKNPPKRLNAN